MFHLHQKKYCVRRLCRAGDAGEKILAGLRKNTAYEEQLMQVNRILAGLEKNTACEVDKILARLRKILRTKSK